MLVLNRRHFFRQIASVCFTAKFLPLFGDPDIPVGCSEPQLASDDPAHSSKQSSDIEKPILLTAAATNSTPTPLVAAVDPRPETWNHLPIRALLMWGPSPEDVALYCRFIRDALPTEGVNTLVAMFNYGFKFKSHPELAEKRSLSREQVREILRACRDAGVKLIPAMNLLAHQSEGEEIGILLKNYPQFDESPDYGPPHPWHAGGQFDFYSKCLCPRHPDLLKVIFPLMDELIEACEADAFHVGLDEAWIVAHDKCPRCGGRDPAEVFAKYTTQLHDHLEEKGCRTWMWSDRLIDGKETGLLAWQASMNNTHRAIDMIPKDIMICDWKYEDASPTPAYFAVKGFDVLPSSCYNANAALAQLEQVYAVRKNASRASFSKTISSRMPGVFATSWMSAKEFIDAYYETTGVSHTDLAKSTTRTFKQLFAEVRKNQSA